MISALAVVFAAFGLLYLLATLLVSRSKRPVGGMGSLPERFVFLVPALNEEAVIRATVRSILRAARPGDLVMVIDDGSSDGTADVVGRIGDPRVALLRRRLPDARQGKGRALNHAYQVIYRSARRAGLDPAAVVICVVDADGRIDPGVIRLVAPYFSDPSVGAVQLLVRIRNRSRLLPKLQDVEFLVFSSVTQTAREYAGSVGLGGNGQFARLSALRSLGPNPWSDCLTEDLDLGIRLAVEGWENRFCGESYIDQQGLESIRALIRQRTRWSQGHFQCWRLIPDIIRSRLPTATVLDLGYYLLAPGAVLVSSVVFTAGAPILALSMINRTAWWSTPFGFFFVLALYLFSFGPALLLAVLYRRKGGDLSRVGTLALGHVLALYNVIWYIAEWRAVGRILTRRGTWAKTGRVVEPSKGRA